MTTKQRWVLALTSVSSLMVALDVIVVSTALSTIRLHLDASIEQLEWTVNAYGLSFAVLLMTASALGDRFGRRRLFAAGMGLFVAASAACALAPSVGWLIAARAVQGAGAAVVAPLSLALLSAAFPPERRGTALGIFSGITGIAVLAGPVVGGAVTQGLAWQWIFWLNVPIGLLAIPLVLRRIDESRGPRASLDVPGLLLVTGAALGLVWGLVRGNTRRLGQRRGRRHAGRGRRARPRRSSPTRRAPASRCCRCGCSARRASRPATRPTSCSTPALFSAVFFFAQFQQNGLGQSPLQAGLRLLPWTATVFIVAPISGATDRADRRAPADRRPGCCMQAAGFAWVALIASVGMSYAAMIPPLILAGAGVSRRDPAGAELGRQLGRPRPTSARPRAPSA